MNGQMKSRKQCCYCSRGMCRCRCHRKLTEREKKAIREAERKELKVLLIFILSVIAFGVGMYLQQHYL